MKYVLQSGNARLYFYLGAIAVMAGLWRVGDAVTQQMSTLPVKMAPRAATQAAQVDQKSYPAVWVKQAAAKSVASEAGPLDALFKGEKVAPSKAVTIGKDGKPVELESMPTPEPDLVAMFMGSVQIQGVADDGMFLNGHFYPVGAKLETLALTGLSGQRVVPRLVSLAGGQATFEVGGKTVTAKLKE